MEQPAWVVYLSTRVGKESQGDVISMLPFELRRKKEGAKFSPLAIDVWVNACRSSHSN
jgi:hypothetical protein